MSDRLDSLENTVAQLVTWVNNVITNAKTVDALDDAVLPFVAGEYTPVSQGGVLKKAETLDLTAGAGGFAFVQSFTATNNQTSVTVNAGVIADDGKWFVQVGSEFWNSTTGITPFPEGNLTINFATGQITFNIPLNSGTQVIIKHN